MPDFSMALNTMAVLGEADTPQFASIHSSLFSAPSDAAPCGLTDLEVIFSIYTATQLSCQAATKSNNPCYNISQRSCSLQVPHHQSLGTKTDPQRMGCSQELRAFDNGIAFPAEHVAFTKQHAVDPRTGEELQFGPAMAEKAIGVDLPALRKLFADITR